MGARLSMLGFSYQFFSEDISSHVFFPHRDGEIYTLDTIANSKFNFVPNCKDNIVSHNIPTELLLCDCEGFEPAGGDEYR